ncbi:hypothetical protein BP6252_01790 [Coleophoma cylindrospora]|uniref:Major facilitator superfamily (MFS) profile domain-containing protein n=1 Tax=Coleophoma cylindrospora TaxID=1849047 RepID=A0A3D8SVE2_9HELO|nr:hypothetical protein BP6252_01790 [Coleophoma cylindrospora]
MTTEKLQMTISTTDQNLTATAEELHHGVSLEKRALRKIDFWLVGFYSIVYIFRVIGSSNYSNAAIINLEAGSNIKTQLHLNESQWAWTLSIFSYSYMVFEPPNTLLLKYFRPSRWMFILILTWGICACSVAAVQNFTGMMVEGLPAIILSVIALFGLPDYPQSAKMLTEEERQFIVQRLPPTAPSGEKGHWNYATLRVLFSDPTLYSFAAYWVAHGIGGFGVAYALPTVIYQLGFTTTSLSQLMNIPPYVACFIFLNTVGYLLHKKWIRPWTTAVAIEATTIICYILLITVPNAVVKYLCLIVAVSCAGSAYPVIWPERIRALDGTVSAGIGIGLTNAMAQFSGIVGPHVYSTVFGPTYHVSYIICLCFLILSILSILASWLLVLRRDRKMS